MRMQSEGLFPARTQSELARQMANASPIDGISI
jgi:hypothetical protein